MKQNKEAVKESVKANVEAAATTTNVVVPATDLATKAKHKLTEAEREFNRLVQEGINLVKENRTPQEIMADKAKALDAALAKNKISAQQFGDAMKRATMVSLNAYAGMASGIANNLASAFSESKAFAIAAAVINTAESITKTLATYGTTPWGIAAAAAAAAAGAAQIMTIANTNKNSGGGGASAAASSVSEAGSAASAATSAPQMLMVRGLTSGQMFSGDVVRDLAAQLIKFQKDGGEVVIA